MGSLLANLVDVARIVTFQPGSALPQSAPWERERAARAAELAAADAPATTDRAAMQEAGRPRRFRLAFLARCGS